MQNTKELKKRTREHFEWPLLVATYGLAMFGIVCIAIATFNPDNGADLSLLNYIFNSTSATWQFTFVMVSPAIVAIAVAIPIDIFKARARLIYYAVLILLVVTLAAATAISGINAWLRVGAGRTIQPAEFAKLSVLIMLAKTLSTKEKPMGTLKEFIRVCMLVGVPAAVVLVQGETGSVIVMVFMFIVMIYFAGVDIRVFLGIVGAGALLIGAFFGYALISGSSDYRIVRILSFLDPLKYQLDGGYQILQAQTAIGSGGLHGIGTFVVGSLSQLDYVPEDHTDFIFAPIGEAFGFIGCCIILAVYLFIFLRMLYLARFTYDKFGQLIIIGVMAMLLIHVFENIAMNIGIMPITGIPLPFLSYGGSNFVTNIAGIALVVNVVRSRSVAPMVTTTSLKI